MIFAHLEVFVDSKKVSQPLRNTAFKRKVQTIVVDEAPACCDRSKEQYINSDVFTATIIAQLDIYMPDIRQVKIAILVNQRVT